MPLAYKSALFILLIMTAITSRAETLVEIPSSRGVTQAFLFQEPTADPVAAVILFAGGKGALKLSKGMLGPNIGWGAKNFLVRTRKQFAEHGFAVATVDAPSDKLGSDGMYHGFRTSAAHVTDIDAVIAWLRKKTDLPVWLIGTSRGTESAAYVALHAKDGVAGVVLTSSMTEPNRKGDPVTELPLQKLTMPVMVVHHTHDACSWTTPAGARRIHAALSNAQPAELRLFEGGRTQGNPCKAMSHHGYLGIESDVVDAIAAFIKQRS